MNFYNSKKNMESNIKIKKLNEEFEKKRSELNDEISKDEPNNETIQKVSEELRNIYSKIHEDEIMKKFSDDKIKFESLVREINSAFMKAAFGDFYDPINYEFGSSCASGCGDCSKC